MIPSHCSDVAIKDVTFRLDESTIRGELAAWKVYRGTGYIVLRNSGRHAILEVPSSGKGLLKKIAQLKVLALPDQVGYVEGPAADTLNHRSVARAAASDPHPFVVVQGEFGHLTFIHKGDGIRIRILDIVPPAPAKLVVLAERALGFLPHDRAVSLQPELVDIAGWATDSRSRHIMFPCRISDAGAPGKDISFLDEAPAIPEGSPITLIGCSLSRKIFLQQYRRSPEFRNFCPEGLLAGAPALGPDERLLTRCCEIESGVVHRGQTCLVPWGASGTDVLEALRLLVRSPATTTD